MTRIPPVASKQKRQSGCKPKRMASLVYLLFALTFAAMVFSYRMIWINVHEQLEWQSRLESESDSESPLQSIPKGVHPVARKKTPSKCAILLFGLPRAFKDFVLPSLEKNVIGPNVQYGCDYFVHYYQQDSEASGRSGNGGAIRSEDVFLLQDSVQRLHQEAHNNNKSINSKHSASKTQTIPEVTFVSDTNETFWEERGTLIEHYRTAKNDDGQYTFYPYGERTYEYPGTLDNIVKQWHSINAVWDVMEEASHKKNTDDRSPHQYHRVAMMRNDVIYLTPIDIYGIPRAANETKKTAAVGDNASANTISVIPNFAKYPVNDRLIYGPYNAVKIWASQRFSRIEDYSKDPLATPGMVMHSETFLNASILQAIKETEANDENDSSSDNNHNKSSNQHRDTPNKLQVLEDKFLCFLRVRADGAIWIEDCDATKSGFGGGYPGGMAEYSKLLQEFLPNNGKGCKQRRLKDKVRKIQELVCPPAKQ